MKRNIEPRIPYVINIKRKYGSEETLYQYFSSIDDAKQYTFELTNPGKYQKPTAHTLSGGKIIIITPNAFCTISTLEQEALDEKEY